MEVYHQILAEAGSVGGWSEDDGLFDVAPVPLWLEDYSALKRLFDQWRAAGVTSLAEHLRADPHRVRQCADCLRVVKVNRKTLSLYEAESLEHLVANLEHVFHDDMYHHLAAELSALWDGQLEFRSHTSNRTMSGRAIDIQLHGAILPGHEDSWSRVLVVTEDVTEREEARHRLALSEVYARGLFDHSPVSLWVEDFSAVKRLMDEIRGRGISDFRVFTDVHPEFVTRCISEVRIIDVNRQTLELLAAPDKPTLLKRLNEVLRDNAERTFREQLVDLWDGKLFQRREVVNYALDGRELHVLMQFSVLPGHERDWSLVQIALTDITARKAAEAYLEFLGKHDALTKLHNRSFYMDELARLQRNAPYPITIVMVDLNGLKETNDQFGHASGDEMLRRAGEVLGQLVGKPSSAARIGGDEFALVLPGCGEEETVKIVADMQRLVEVNNHFYNGTPLSLSIGWATSLPGERLEEVSKRADARMYEAKQSHYAPVASAVV